jgi:hypothetical protein
MTHSEHCRVYTEIIAGEPVTYSDPDPECTDTSHNQDLAQEIAA